MALVSVGDEGDAITLSRTNKVTLVSMSPRTQATAHSCTDKVTTLVSMAGCMIEEHIVALVGLVQTIISKNIAKYFVR